MSAEYAPVRVVFRGWREKYGKRETVEDGSFPSVNEIGIDGRQSGKPNFPFTNAKKLYGIMISALLRELPGSEYEFIKPGTKGVKCILPIDREGELPTGAGFVLMEGRCVYPNLQTRDQNNVVAIIAKFVPDVLENDGYLAAHDDWFGFQTGNFGRGLNRAVPAYTELMFFPSPDRIVPVDEGAPPPAQGTIL
jgi:hypothetical protein